MSTSLTEKKLQDAEVTQYIIDSLCFFPPTIDVVRNVVRIYGLKKSKATKLVTKFQELLKHAIEPSHIMQIANSLVEMNKKSVRLINQHFLTDDCDNETDYLKKLTVGIKLLNETQKNLMTFTESYMKEKKELEKSVEDSDLHVKNNIEKELNKLQINE